jgi:hypothetical protein
MKGGRGRGRARERARARERERERERERDRERAKEKERGEQINKRGPYRTRRLSRNGIRLLTGISLALLPVDERSQKGSKKAERGERKR